MNIQEIELELLDYFEFIVAKTQLTNFTLTDMAAVEYGIRGGTPIGQENYRIARLILERIGARQNDG